tara:strand:- start:1583 stop:2128 length:546 start_codon:yes stop_codon:yes gene_type:complete
MNTSYNLNDSWVFWTHYSNDTNWGLNSYKCITKFNDLISAIKIIEYININIINNCNCFIMKNNCLPLWEDETNINGGNFSYKIYSKDILKIWKHLCYRLIGNTLTSDEDILNNINGISISSKRNFYIIKFWLRDTKNITEKNKIFYDFIHTNTNTNISDPFSISNLCNIDPLVCIFKLHKI